MNTKILVLAFLMLLLLPMLSISYAQSGNVTTEAPDAKIYTLNLDGRKYEISYAAGNATLESIQVDVPTYTITITLSHTDQNGRLEISMPRDIVDNVANIGNLAVFIDDENSDYTEVYGTCDSRIMSIDYPEGTETIELVGTSTAATGFPHYVVGEPTLQFQVDGKKYFVGAHTRDKVCSWQFLKEKKTLLIRSDNMTEISLSIPAELLGSPYTVFMDGNKVDNFNMTSFSSERGDFNSLSIDSEKGAKSIEIVGTTAIPEFSSLLLLPIMAGAIGIVVMTVRMIRFREWKN